MSQEIEQDKESQEQPEPAAPAPIEASGSERCPRCGALPDKGETRCPVCEVETAGPEASEDTKARAGLVREVARGIAYFPKGFYFLLSHRVLWKLAIIPLLMNIACLILAFLAAYWLQDYLLEDLGKSSDQWQGWHWVTLSWIIKIGVAGLRMLSFLLVPLAVAFLFTLFGKFLFMPFMELLSARSEKLFLGHVVEESFTIARFSSDLVVSIFDAVLLTLSQLLLYLLLLPINLVPLLGNLIWFMLPGAVFASMDYTDMNFIRRRYAFRERLNTWNRYRWRFFGFGLAFFFFLAMPLLNFVTGIFVIPTACVGGTLLYLELDNK